MYNRDRNGNLLKIGDKIKRVVDTYKFGRITTGKVYIIISTYTYFPGVEVINDCNELEWFNAENFIKVNNCLKIKIRKLKKLIRKA